MKSKRHVQVNEELGDVVQFDINVTLKLSIFIAVSLPIVIRPYCGIIEGCTGGFYNRGLFCMSMRDR